MYIALKYPVSQSILKKINIQAEECVVQEHIEILPEIEYENLTIKFTLEYAKISEYEKYSYYRATLYKNNQIKCIVNAEDLTRFDLTCIEEGLHLLILIEKI